MVPNVVLDWLPGLLTGAEYTLLLYCIRRTSGFQRQSFTMSQRQLEDGVMVHGRRQELGCGLARSTIIKARNGLARFGILLVLDPGDAQSRRPGRYAIVLDSRKWDWNGLFERRQQRFPAKRQQTEEAQAAVMAWLSSIDEAGAAGVPEAGTSPIPDPGADEMPAHGAGGAPSGNKADTGEEGTREEGKVGNVNDSAAVSGFALHPLPPLPLRLPQANANRLHCPYHKRATHPRHVPHLARQRVQRAGRRRVRHRAAPLEAGSLTAGARSWPCGKSTTVRFSGSTDTGSCPCCVSMARSG